MPILAQIDPEEIISKLIKWRCSSLLILDYYLKHWFIFIILSNFNDNFTYQLS